MSKPGRKSRFTVAEIGKAAMAIADAGGLESLSMRTLSDALGLSTMALYRYVPGKPELLDLIIDLAYSELPREQPSEGNWAQRLERVARDEWALYLAHPWMLGVSTYRAALGPHALRKYERELRAIVDAGLTDLDMDLVVLSLSNFVRGAARHALDAQRATADTGQTNDAWWTAHAQSLGELVQEEDFPIASRVGTAAGMAYGGPADPAIAFEFGLARYLDGVKALPSAGASRSAG
ncbi:TetR/AcrR family transcriptional regulator [Massilia scottii]|uniref:TetR/AcrR family transcriptional regulator n=1 Tax=Massilia scottii TaxID=3057166 RepID=UPI00279668BD|nr:TetR/AcrR family transcriptional regulator C-terminal domain-containing protein [Massilia sp. CCM 9029]MDQ1833807.1 TetR/AcrR family transcriptional regulator C-terminal domain-containing protein [Massilia sp. CCM 9029]